MKVDIHLNSTKLFKNGHSLELCPLLQYKLLRYKRDTSFILCYAFLKAFLPANLEYLPNSCSMRMSWLNFSIRSPRQPLPVFK